MHRVITYTALCGLILGVQVSSCRTQLTTIEKPAHRTAKLYGLGIEVQLDADESYRIEYVRNVPMRREQLLNPGSNNPLANLEKFPVRVEAMHKELWDDLLEPDPYDCPGIYLPIRKSDRTECYAIINDNLDNKTVTYVTCALHGAFLWKRDPDEIYRYFREPEKVRSQIGEIEEYMALCGWIGLHRMIGNCAELQLRRSDTATRQMNERIRNIVVEQYKE